MTTQSQDPRPVTQEARKLLMDAMGALKWKHVLGRMVTPDEAMSAIEAALSRQEASGEVREALAWFVKRRKSIENDVRSAHSGRGAGASEWMREDDRDFRSDLSKAFDAAEAALSAQPLADAGDVPIPMLLWCPQCHLQHIDEPDERTPDWDNPPHRSHLCHGCGCIWRPADVPTEGVRDIKTAGKADTFAPSTAPDELLTCPTCGTSDDEFCSDGFHAAPDELRAEGDVVLLGGNPQTWSHRVVCAVKARLEPIKQRDLAEQVGVSEARISQILNDCPNWTIGTVERLLMAADALKDPARCD